MRERERGVRERGDGREGEEEKKRERNGDRNEKGRT